MSVFETYKVSVPEGRSGNWSIERFTVTEDKARFHQLQSLFAGRGGVKAGTYTGLYRDGYVIMSDTPDEIRDHIQFIHRATGNVLINGLGLGMCLQAVAKKPEVTHVTVIEQSEDVINLVSQHYLTMFPGKIIIVHADAYTYQPPKGMRYDTVWHDIWDDICLDNLPEMEKLHRKYGRRCDWQGSWCKEYLLYRRGK